ncbi:MAG: hypothetical protein WBC47_07445 [Dehalococcoidia bacterium]
MRKLAVILAPLLILAIALTAIGCGEGESPTPTPEPSPTATAEPTPEPTVAPTPTPSPTPIPTPVPTLSTEPPCRFHGTVKLNGANVADGTIIKAIIDGDEYTTTTPAVYGPSTYALKIVPAVGYAEGTAITFMIGAYTATQTGSWETGGNIELDLTASTT